MFKVIATEGSVKVGMKGYHKQALWILLYGENGKPDPYPTQFDKIHGPEDKPFPPGEYIIAPQSFKAVVNEKGNKSLSMTRLTLLPATQSK